MYMIIKNLARYLLIVVIACFSFAFDRPAHAQITPPETILRVDGLDGCDMNCDPLPDGQSWGTGAFKYLQDALVEAAASTPPVAIWVRGGPVEEPVLYRPDQGDAEADADWMAGKLARLRIFRDGQDKMNRSVQDIKGEALVISQFTLAGETSKGNRPSFIGAAAPEVGAKLYERVCDALQREHNVPTKRGVFGAMMSVEIINDGPVTLIVCKTAD